MGILLSLPLYWVSMRIWDKSLLLRGSISFFLVALMALVWTMIRLITFIWMTKEQGLWEDFGGWYFGSVFIFLCWSITFHGIRYYQLSQSEHKIMLAAEALSREEHIKRISAQNVARDAQLKMLRYQLNPHFLCNTLNAINSLVEIEESEKAQRMIVQLSKFLRYSLDNNPDTKIALEKEISALKLYLEIEKTRFGDRLILDFQIDEQAKSAGIPSLLLQPLIENSMKHAIAQSEEGGTISLRAYVTDNKLVLELCDTGSDVKIQQSKILSSNGRGVGLRNTDERLETLYPNNYDFILKILASGGLKSTIKIPYEPIDGSSNKHKLAV
ncbi:MAG: two-component system LytT family sensor kinase [Paraglaciecola sp.]|jgi:two-component system LytT family sensor kinase